MPDIDEHPQIEPAFPLVIGVGASVADRDSLFSFLAGLNGEEAAVILCLTQQEAADEKALAKRLAKASGRRVLFADDGAALEVGTIYLVRSAEVATIEDNRIATRPSSEPMGERGRIDSLLVSIARAQGEHAVAVVLAGVGGDGTLGAATMKEQGGLIIAQETEPDGRSAAFLANGAATSIADYVLPPDKIAECIVHYRDHLTRRTEAMTAQAEREEIGQQLGRVATILRNKTGHDFHGYKQNTFMRRVQRRMQVARSDNVDDYINYLREDPEEVQHLFNDMLIGVTQFFRDAREFELLEKEVIPKLFEGKTAADQVRVWVLGCATGEEAYSLAILLREHMATIDAVPHVQLFATDIDGRALASARVGRFPATIARDISPERLARWFVKEGDTYSVVKELREMCIFSQHNFIKDAPFSRLDIISCRNLLIYLNNDLQNRIIPLFHFSLLPGGFLFLGNSENVTRHAKLFAPIDRRYRVFRKLETGSRVLPDFPLTAVSDRPRGEPGPRPRGAESNLARRAERVAERYAPAYAVVDEHHEALHFSGRTGRFLDPTTGTATLNLVNLVHRDLRLDLRAALQKAAAENAPVKVPPLRMGVNGEAVAVNISVEPVTGSPDEPQHFIVLFQAGESVADDSEAAATPLIRDEHVQRLENELRITRERLQATIEELESTNEELKSSNEEYQSINEELQSANEELETSKEELQSVNEELQTVNGELAHRVQELGRANSDLKNLLESTQIATIFLDNDLRVRNFTPAVTEIFHLIDSDLGRPITHIAGKISYDELTDDVRRVMRTLATVEREVSDPRSGTRYLIRILPYRSVENFIGGVVLTFLDITALANAEQALRESEERFRRMAGAVPIVLFTALPDLRFDYVNERFHELTGMTAASASDHGWLTALHPDDVEPVREAWREAASAERPLELEMRVRTPQIGYRWMLVRAEAIRDAKGKIERWYGSASDVNDLKLATERQNLLMAELQHRVKNILAVVRSIFTRTAEAGDSMEEMADHFRGRLDALARTQTVLARSPDGSIELEDLVRDELLSVGAPMDDKVAIAGAPVRLRHKAAEALGLAVHELATNAIKYGALVNDGGMIEIDWRVIDDKDDGKPRLHFEWREKGVRIVNAEPPRSGFGTELITQGLAYQLGATAALEFAPGGVRCAINVPLVETLLP